MWWFWISLWQNSRIITYIVISHGWLWGLDICDGSNCGRPRVHFFPGGSDDTESACNAGDQGLIPGLGSSPGEGNDTCSSILAWRIPWTKEPGGLQSMGSQRVGHDWETSAQLRCVFTGISLGKAVCTYWVWLCIGYKVLKTAEKIRM